MGTVPVKRLGAARAVPARPVPGLADSADQLGASWAELGRAWRMPGQVGPRSGQASPACQGQARQPDLGALKRPHIPIFLPPVRKSFVREGAQKASPRPEVEKLGLGCRAGQSSPRSGSGWPKAMPAQARPAQGQARPKAGPAQGHARPPQGQAAPRLGQVGLACQGSGGVRTGV